MKSSKLLAIVGPIAILVACSGGGGGSSATSGGGGVTPSSGQSTVKMSMVDGPFRTSGGTVTAVNITVAKVELIGNGGTQTIATFTPSQQINIMNFQTAPGIQLGTLAIPAGMYQQARILLDTSQPSNNTVTVNGTTFNLKIPSATGPTSNFNGGSSMDNGDGPGSSGIKINLGLNAVGGQTYSILLDFNAAESIVQAGNSGQWIMKPVIVATAYASGFFGGTATMNGAPIANAEILAEQNGLPINSGVTGSDGTYAINALPQGAYSIIINNVWTSQAGQAETASPSNGVASGTCAASYTITTGQTTVNIAENPTPGPSPSATPSPSPSAAPSATPSATPAAPFVCSP